ncbi:hypothetical protein MTO96_023516 [Rhipicephalus appendiculatus]
MDGAGCSKTFEDMPVGLLGSSLLVMYREPSLSDCLRNCGTTMHVDEQQTFLFSANQRTSSKSQRDCYLSSSRSQWSAAKKRCFSRGTVFELIMQPCKCEWKRQR